MISFCADEIVVTDCVTVIVVPENAVSEPGYIKMLTSSVDSGAKHEFHAMAQMAYYQYQDDELEINTMHGVCVVTHGDEKEELHAGMIIYRHGDGGVIGVAIHDGLNPKKLLEAANRFCTRWIRLDI